jgi:hypothetical protein
MIEGVIDRLLEHTESRTAYNQGNSTVIGSDELTESEEYYVVPADHEDAVPEDWEDRRVMAVYRKAD